MKVFKTLFGTLTITLGLFNQAQAQTFLTNGLVAFYPFDGNANDASGKGNNGIIYGASFQTNIAGRAIALNFNGNSAAYVRVPRSASLEPVDSISVTLWCKGVPGGARITGPCCERLMVASPDITSERPATALTSPPRSKSI
jgi:hypothetical protein